MTLMAISMGQRTCTQKTPNITQTLILYFLLKSLPLPGGDLQANVCGDMVGETTLKNHCICIFFACLGLGPGPGQGFGPRPGGLGPPFFYKQLIA